MSLGEKNSLRHRTRQVLLKGRQDLDPTPQLGANPIPSNLHLPLSSTSSFYNPISSSIWNNIVTLRGNYNQLLGVADPSTATNFGGEVVGGVPLIGTFYPTPTPLTSVSTGVNPARSSSTRKDPSHPVTSTQSPTKSTIPTRPTMAQTPTRDPSAAVTGSPSTSMIPKVPMPVDSGNASTQQPESSYNKQLSAGTITGIIIGVILIILMTLLACWYTQRRRQEKQAKIRNQRQSFLQNPIVNSLLVPNQSIPSFRGTPYQGEEGDMYYAAPSIASNRDLRVESNPRLSHMPRLDTLDHSRLNEVNYLEVMNTHPRGDSFFSTKETVPKDLHASVGLGAYFSNTYTNTPNQFLSPNPLSEPSEESSSFRTRRSTLRSIFSASSILFPQVAIFRSGPKNEAGIPIQNLEANRVKSQIATGMSDYNEEPDQESELGSRHSRMADGEFLSFYLPRAGDPTKISYNRVDLPTQSLISRTTNFSYPIPRASAADSPPDLPGPILNRPRFHYGRRAAQREEDANKPISPKNLGVESTRPGSTATPSFANNRYIPSKGRKRKTNANVLSVLHKSSLRKSSGKAVPVPKRQSVSRRGDRRTISTVNSIDVPDPYAYVTTSANTFATPG